MKFLIYSLHEPGSEEVRYAGRSSSGLSRPGEHLREAKAKRDDGTWSSQLYVNRWIRSLEGLVFEIRVVEEWDGTGTSNSWLNERERYWIAFFRARGDRLTNATDGG